MGDRMRTSVKVDEAKAARVERVVKEADEALARLQEQSSWRPRYVKPMGKYEVDQALSAIQLAPLDVALCP